MGEERKTAVVLNLEKFLDSEDLCDGVIKCGDEEFKIHKIVLCAQSKYFVKVFCGQMKEAKDGVVSLGDDDVSVVGAMLRFMYTSDFDAAGGQEAIVSPMVFNAKVYSIADKYDIPTLKDLAKDKFTESLCKCWDMDDFPRAVVEVYSSTPTTDKGLREVVVETSSEHIVSLLEKQQFQNTLENTIGFASDLTKRLADGKDLIKYKCPHCAKLWSHSDPTGTYYCPHCASRRSDWSAHRA